MRFLLIRPTLLSGIGLLAFPCICTKILIMELNRGEYFPIITHINPCTMRAGSINARVVSP